MRDDGDGHSADRVYVEEESAKSRDIICRVLGDGQLDITIGADISRSGQGNSDADCTTLSNIISRLECNTIGGIVGTDSVCKRNGASSNFQQV